MKRKNYLPLIVMAVISCVMLSCNKESKKLKIDCIPYKLEKSDNWGMLKSDGTPLFKDEFENMPSLAINGVFTVESKDGVTVYTATEKPKAIKDCENLKEAGVMSEGIIPIVRKNERIKFVDINGKEKFTLMPYKNKEIEKVSSSFFDGLAWIQTSENKYGWINTSGKVVIEPKYDKIIAFFNDGLAVMGKKEKDKDGNEKIVNIIIDKDGKEIKKLKDNVEILSWYYDNHFIAKAGDDEKRIVLLDKKGEITKKLPTKIKGLTYCKGDKYIYRNDEGKYGLNNMKDETIIRAKYDLLASLKNGNYIAKKNSEKWVIINEKDDKIKEFEDYKFMSYFEDWDIIIAQNKDYKFELLSLKGESLSKEEYIMRFETPDSVSSDYFNVDDIAATITDYISDNGIGNVKFGDNVSKLLADRSPYSYKNEDYALLYSSESGLKSGTKYSLELGIFSNMAIAEANYRTEYYYGYAFRRYDGTKFNTNAKVSGFLLSTFLQTSDKLKNLEILATTLKDNLTKKGYKVIDKGTYCFELQKGDNNLLITPVIDNNRARLFLSLVPKDVRKNGLPIKEADEQYIKDRKNYKEEKDSYDSDYDYDDYGYPIETMTETAVEEQWSETSTW